MRIMVELRAVDDHQILADLARALVDQPRANLHQLATAAGISKATLYRFCRTRDELVERLMAHGTQLTTAAIEGAELDRGAPLEALRRLTGRSLEHRELNVFLMHYWKPGGSCADPATHARWEAAVDQFFLRGQQEGVFRIDIPAAALTEIWVSMLLGLMEAERQGRVARVGLVALMEQVFLHGAMA